MILAASPLTEKTRVKTFIELIDNLLKQSSWSGQPCVFPFLAGARLEYSCTRTGDLYGEEWCATSTDQEHSVRRWGHCSLACRNRQDNGEQERTER